MFCGCLPSPAKAEHEGVCSFDLSQIKKKAADHLGGLKLSQVANVGSFLVHCNTVLIEQVKRVLNYSQFCVEEYGLLLLTAKTTEIVQAMM